MATLALPLSGSDDRASSRRHCHGALSLECDGDAASAEWRDVSFQGARLDSERYIRPGREVALEWAGHTAVGRVAWSRRSGAGRFAMGVRVVAPSAAWMFWVLSTAAKSLGNESNKLQPTG